jgi:putative peptidoglycan lipid II flippase
MIRGSGFARTALRLGLLSLASSGLGFLREVLIVRKFGASPLTDAYIAAYSVPILFFSLTFGSGMSLALVPPLTAQNTADPSAANRSFGEFLSLAILPGAAVTLFILFFRGALIRFFTPGLKDSALAADFLATLSPLYFLLLAATSFGIYHCARYATHLFGMLSVIQNGVMVAGMVLLGKAMGIQSLVLCTLAGCAGAFLFELRMARRAGFVEPWTPPSRSSGGAKLMLALLPFLVTFGIGESGTSVADIVLVRYFASLLEPGAITLLTLGNKLTGMPAMLIGAAMGTALLPAASRMARLGDAAGLARQFRLAMTVATVLTAPLVVLYVDAPELVVAIVLSGSRIGPAQFAELAAILRCYAPSIAGWTCVYVMCSVIAATGSTYYLVGCGLVSLSLSALMMHYFGIWLGAPGIALSVSVALFLYLGMLGVRLASRIEMGSAASLLKPAAIVLGGALGMHLLILAGRAVLPAIAFMPAALMFYGIWSIVNRGRLQLNEVFSA